MILIINESEFVDRDFTIRDVMVPYQSNVMPDFTAKPMYIHIFTLQTS